jgi:saccharopine dehydrogenase-like NADP-dependent oxidoreductase
MKKRGVKNCSYKTLRYRGHCEIVKFLIRNCDLDDETLNQIFEVGCGLVNKDEVIIIAEVKGGNRTWKKEELIKADKNFSAMQKATAFPVSSTAALMAKGVFDKDMEQHRDYWTPYPKSLSYNHIRYNEFNENLKKLGLVS